ncbi:MAG: type II toxin-antitoxin system RelE/ParE family toxin [Bacilli bacterium]|nr:type II toxin-antitoxin system RelE/ParE family toxin [Bacilli bacterium]
MSYQIKYSPIALDDLDRAFYEVYQASFDTIIAREYINDLLDKIEGKVDFPESGSPLIYDNIFTGYRYVVFKSYIAFYYVEKNTIFVDRVLYAKSDYIKKLKLN